MKLNENERAFEIYFEDLSEDAKKYLIEGLGEDKLNSNAPIGYYPVPLNIEDEKAKFIQSIVLGVRPLQEDLVAGITVTKCAALGTTISEKGKEEYIWFAEDNYPEEPLLINMKDENPGFDPDMLGHLATVINNRNLTLNINTLLTIGNSDNIKLSVSYNVEKSDPVNNTLYLKDIIIDRNLHIGSEFFLISIAMHDDVVIIIKEADQDSNNFIQDEEIYKIITNPFEYDAEYNSARDGYMNISNSRIIVDSKQNYDKDPYYLAVKKLNDNISNIN